MSLKCGDIIAIAEEFAPSSWAENWDNVGLIIGSRDREVTKVLVALDATDEVVDEALNMGAELIVTHHPIIFEAVKRINNETSQGRKLLKVIENKICVYSLHTNLDIANGGTNDELAGLLQLADIQPMFSIANVADVGLGLAIGRKGTLSKPLKLEEFAGFVKNELRLNSIRFVGDAERIVKTVGISTGSGSNAKNFKEAKESMCDVYITGDIRFHEAQDALSMGLCLIDATHYASENLIVKKLTDIIQTNLHKNKIDIPIEASKVDGQVFKNA